jgi:outer membrane protein insertion porin family
MERTTRTLILGMILAGIFAIPLMSQTNPQYRIGEITIVGAQQFNSAMIKQTLGLNPGEVYNDSQRRNGFVNLKTLYGTRGYLNFTAVPVENIDEQKKVINLTINIDEDRQFSIGHIVFTGNTTISEDKIRRELLVKEGDVFNAQNWDFSMLRLSQIGYFDVIKSEDVSIKPSATEPTLDINVTVREKERK